MILAGIALVLTAFYFLLQTSPVQTRIIRYVASQIAKNTGTDIQIGKVQIAFFHKMVLKDVLVETQNRDTLFYTSKVSAHLDTLKFKKRRISFSQVEFEKSRIEITRDTSGKFNFADLLQSEKTEKESLDTWLIRCNRFTFLNSGVAYLDLKDNLQKQFFVREMNLEISDLLKSGDSVNLHIDRFTLQTSKDLSVQHLSSGFSYSGDRISFNNLELKTGLSELRAPGVSLVFGDTLDENRPEMSYNVEIADAVISLRELGQVFPGIRGMDQEVKVSGQVSGNKEDIKGRNVVVKTGLSTSAILDFSVNGLQDPETMFLFVDLKDSRTTFRDLSRFRLPDGSKIKNLAFPEPLYQAGTLTYQGNFTGFLSDFVAFGTFNSDMGILTTDVSVVPEEGGSIGLRGKLNTTDFDLGKLFRENKLGKFTFNGNVDGHYNKNSHALDGNFIGYINKLEYNKYTYSNIVFDGTLDKKMFDGMLSINDPNLRFDFSGQMNFNPKIPVFDFRLDMEKALPEKLHLAEKYPDAELDFIMKANFTGDRLDNIEGSIMLEKGTYRNRNGSIDLDGISLTSVPGNEKDRLFFSSDFFDLEINGKYHFQTLVQALKQTFASYLPAISEEVIRNEKFNRFNFQLNVKQPDSLLAAFVPDIHVESPFFLYGAIDEEANITEVEGSIHAIQTENMRINNIFIGNKPSGSEYTSKFRIGEILLRNKLALYNLSVESRISDNILDNQITWTNYHDLTYSGVIKTRSRFSRDSISGKTQIDIEGFPSQIYMADSLWEISSFRASLDSTAIEIENFNITHGDQKFKLDGQISDDPSAYLSVLFENIRLDQVGTYLGKEIPVKGVISGTAGISDFYEKKRMFSDISLKDFAFRNQYIGNVSLVNDWDHLSNVLNSRITILSGDRESLVAEGTFHPETQEIRYEARADHLSVVLLETVLQKSFSNVHGEATGKVVISGKPDKILMHGALEGLNAGLTINYTQVGYQFTDSVYFRGDTILFDNITIRDVNNRQGRFGGTIVHSNFQQMIYNLYLTTPGMLVLNTSMRDNEQFFGKVYASGRLDITGRGTSVNLTGSGTTLQGTGVNISLEYESEIEQYDFIRFVSSEESEKEEMLFPEKKGGDFNLNLTIRATPDARAQLIYNSNIGDVIKAQGEGILLFGMDKDGNITLSGNYTVERGDYLFTLQNVINKRFTIEQGGSIVWSGDPYNALIDINAVYRLKASLYDLLVNTYNNVYQNQRIPVECKIILTEQLSNPVINFRVDFPTVEDRIIDELQQFFNTDEEMNKQILSLLILGKFYTPEYMRGTYEAQNPNLIGTTASELFSNQLSNWLSQISNNVDVGLNYRPGNQITNDEIELALSTQMFNDRVTINGNIGNNVNPNSSNSSNLVGDFDISVKLIPSGKIQLKAYNRSNNNLIYETSPYTQGVGFSFKEEYNTFRELIRKLGSLFRKKKEDEF